MNLWTSRVSCVNSSTAKSEKIDDTVVFCGGIDLTANRWDTPNHRLKDPRRKNPD